MLIVCPTCATSYMIEPATLGSAGRAVRCVRCKATWFAEGPQPEPGVIAFVDDVIAEAEAQSADAAPDNAAATAGPFDGTPSGATAEPPPLTAADLTAPQDGAPVSGDSDLVPLQGHAPEPVTIADAPPLVPALELAALPDAAHAEPDSDDIESFAARRQRLMARRQNARKSSRWTALILVLFAVNVALLGGRSEVVRYLPQTASLFATIGLPVNLRHLKFEDVKISKESQDGVAILIVQGKIVSTGGRPAEVPRLRFAARNATGQEVYTWTALPARSILGPGEQFAFSSRLAAPPADANDVMVRFFNSQDAAAGAK